MYVFDVAESPLPDLSFHCVTVEVFNTKVEVSAASNHNEHPGIKSGEKGVEVGRL